MDCTAELMNIDATLDAIGLNCPLPILKTKKALASLLLPMIATDPGSVNDFEVFSKRGGFALLESREESGKFYCLPKKILAGKLSCC